MDLGLLRQDSSLVFTISLSVSIGGQMLAGALNRRVQSRYIYWLIAVFSLLGFFGTAQAKGLWGLYLFYGVFSGLAIGMIYNLVLTGVSAQFTSNLNLVSGILLMGFGMGPLLLGMLAASLISATGWRFTFVALAVFYTVVLVAASWLIPSRKSQDVPAVGYTRGVSTGQMLRSRPYQMFFLWCVMMGASTLIVTGHSSLISRDIGASFAGASLMTGVVAVASGLTRPFFGRIADLYGGNVLKTALTFCIVGGSTACLLGYITANVPVLVLGFVLAGSANGGGAVYICSFVQSRFGNAHYGINMAVTNVYMILGSLLGPALAGVLKTYTGRYTMALVAMLAFAAMSVLAGLWLGKEKTKSKEENGKKET